MTLPTVKETFDKIEVVVAAHPSTVERCGWLGMSCRVRCNCGYVSQKMPRRYAMTFGRADHWAAVAGIRKFRTIEDIRAGR